MDNIIFLSPADQAQSVTTFTQQQQALRDALEAQRLIMQYAGFPYTFSPEIPATLADDGVTVISPAITAVVGTIQTRDPPGYSDRININGLATEALILAGQGVTSPVQSFRDAQDVTHAMTPAQMQALGLAVGNFISATYRAKWKILDEIDALTPQTIGAFDITQGWTIS